MNAEKWIDGCECNPKVINPAYVEELEAFAKKMAEVVVEIGREFKKDYPVGGELEKRTARAEQYLKERT